MHRSARLVTSIGTAILLTVTAGCAGSDDDAPPEPTGQPTGTPTGQVTEPPAEPGPTPAPSPTEGDEWATGPVSGTGAATARDPAELAEVRTGEHEDFDRVVFEFAEQLPDYQVEYVEQVQRPGSGQPVDLRGDRQVRVTLDHVARTSDRRTTPSLPAIREVRQFPSFEGTVAAGLGVTGENARPPLRVGAVGSRLYVDITHAAPGDQPPPDEEPDALLRRGDSGQAVAEVQRRLRELDYWIESVDGQFGPLTEQAVYALQKAAGASRDGIVGQRTREALTEGVRPSARSDGDHVVEVDLDRQLLMLVENGNVERIFSTSTGTFDHYTYGGEQYLADTPRGHWEVYRQVDGWDPGPLGRLYRPKYFHTQGIAVHGYADVPPYPASHGCVRVTITAMDWLWRTDQLPDGTPVWVY